MLLDFSLLDPRSAYGWMISTIVPRPIAWVSTIGLEMTAPNLAPFSFFQGVTSRPPTLMFVPVTKGDGTPKDTLRNIEETKEFVVNLVSAKQTESMNATASALPYGESEFSRYGVESVRSERVRPPRVKASPVAFECVLHSIVRMGDEPGVANVVFGRILCAHVDDLLLDEAGKLDPAKLDLVGRMGGENYCFTREQFRIERP